MKCILFEIRKVVDKHGIVLVEFRVVCDLDSFLSTSRGCVFQKYVTGGIFRVWFSRIERVGDGSELSKNFVDDGLKLGQPVGPDLRKAVDDDDIFHSIGFFRFLLEDVRKQL